MFTSPSWTLLSPQACLDLARQILLSGTKKSARITTQGTERTPASGMPLISVTRLWSGPNEESLPTRSTATNAVGGSADVAYDNLVTEVSAGDLKPGDTFVSTDWQYAFIVVNPAVWGFVPDPNLVYVWSLVENAGQAIPSGQTCKKLKMWYYTFQE